MAHLFRTAILSGAAFGFIVATAAAAQAQVVPNTARPEVIERDNRIQDARPDVGGASVISTPDTHKKHTGTGPKFELKHIALEGATVYSEKDLESLYAGKLGTKITIDDLNDVAADITSYYRNHGYILTRAVVPPQKATGGDVTIRIVEGFVNDVRLQGDVNNDPLLAAYAEKIKAAKPLNADTLERYLLLMEDLPGVEARAVLEPAKNTTGATDVIVNIKRRTVEGSASLDNRGNRFLGPIQASGSLLLNNLLGLDDLTQVRLTSSIVHPDELAFYELRHTEQVGHEGTTVTLAANKVHTQPGESLDPLDIQGDSAAFSLSANHPLIRSRRTNWFVNADFTARNVEVETLGVSLYKDRTKVLTVGTAYDFVDRWSAINKAELNIGKGFNWDTSQGLNARSRANGETAFVKTTAKATRIQPIYGPFSILASASGQYSPDALLASEEFAVGGAEFGSAYDSAEITGDSGVAGRAELQYNQSGVNDIINQYQLYGFYDIGQVWNRDPIPGSEKSSDTLSSAGLGARMNLLESITAGVEGAVPLTRDVAARNGAGEDPRVFFNLQYRY